MSFTCDFAEYAASLGFNLIRVAEMKDGVTDTLAVGYQNPCQDLYSISKAFTVTAIGLLYDRGIIKPQDKAAEILGIREAADERFFDITVEHLLTHRAGFCDGELDIDCMDANLFGRDYLKYLTEKPLVYDPGSEDRYSDAAFYVLSRIATKLSGEKIDDLLWREILFPLGFREFAWSRCPLGYPMGATGVYTRAEDAVKLADLYVRYGGGILSKEWCSLVLSKPYEFHPVGIGRAFAKGGMRGQMLIGIPEQNRSVCFVACDDGDIQPLVDFAVRGA